jgi:soluble lytic murein transglycosylase
LSHIFSTAMKKNSLSGLALLSSGVIAFLFSLTVTQAQAIENPPLPLASPLTGSASSGPTKTAPPVRQAAPASTSFRQQAFAQKDKELLNVVAAHMREREGQAALATANRISHEALRKTALWLIAADQSDDLSSSQLLQINQQLIGWPSLSRRQRRVEDRLWMEKAPLGDVKAIFGQTPPEGLTGHLLRVQAYKKAGKTAEARKSLAPYWYDSNLSASEEKVILREAGDILTSDDHFIRANQMLYRDRVSSAARMKPYLTDQQRQLLDARAAVSKGNKKAIAMLNDLPKSMRNSPHAQFSLAQAYRRSEQFDKAAKKLLAVKATSAADIINPKEWWIERRVLAREFLELKQSKTAYRIVTERVRAEPASEADAEFHAGWIALRFLNDPARAAKHFYALYQIGTTPITSSRAAYWLGRALESAGEKEKAKGYLDLAATYGETFYGQMARNYLKLTGLGLAPLPIIREDQTQSFYNLEQVQALQVLEQMDDETNARRFAIHLAETLPRESDLVQLAALARAYKDHNTELAIGKEAANRFRSLALLAYPVHAMPDNVALPNNMEKALIMAVARQESAFQAHAVSSAGARGLLQLLPTTAQGVARKKGLPYSRSRLTSDAGYNATLGAHFLDDLLQQFNGSYIFTFAAYNAGPGRIPQWVERFGDPNINQIDTLDWIESIPFTETRNYVQRCLENLHVYRHLLK